MINKIKIKYLLVVAVVSISAMPLKAQNSKRILETFLDSQSKPTYPVADVYTPTGYWLFDGALVTPNEKLDIRPKAPRILSAATENGQSGFISTNYEVKGLQKIKVGFIGFQADNGPFAVEVLVSADKGKTWKSLGSKPGDPTKQEETIAEFVVDNAIKTSYRVKIANASAPKANRLNRINITEVQLIYGE